MIKRLLATALILTTAIQSVGYAIDHFDDYQDGSSTPALITFNTFKSDGTLGATTGLTVYLRKGSTTITDAETLTANAHSIDGYHTVSVDLTNAAIVPGDWDVMASAGTVDGVDLTGDILAHFSVGRYANVATDSNGGVELATAERSKLTGFANVVYIQTTDDQEAAIEGASAGTLCLLAPGEHDEPDAIVIPAGVVVRGAGIDSTHLKSTSASPTFVTPSDGSVIEDLTVTAEVGVAIGLSGATQVDGAVVRRVRTTPQSIVGVQVTSSAASTLSVYEGQITGQLDGVISNSAAHDVAVYDSNVRCTDNGADGVFASGTAKIRMYGGSVSMDNASEAAVRAAGNGTVEAFGVDINGAVSADAGTAAIRLVDCEADRSLFVGGTITDILSPDIADLPTSSEFTARTLPAGNYSTASQLSDVETAILGVPTNAEFAAALDAIPTAAENVTELLGTTLTDTGAGKAGRAMYYQLQSFVSSGKFSTSALENAPSGGEGGETQPRVNFDPSPGFTVEISSGADGTYKAQPTIRVNAGPVEDVYVFINMKNKFGAKDYVKTVGTPVVSGGSITAAAEGPRDTYAVVKLEGTATAGEARTVRVPVTMVSGTTIPVVFDVKVYSE